MTRPSVAGFLMLALLLSCVFCRGNLVSVSTDNVSSNVASRQFGHGTFTGETTVEFTFVASLGGTILAQDFQPTSLSSHSATKDLIEGIEDLVHAVLATSGNANELQTNNVSLIDGVRPHVNIVTDVECPSTVSYAAANDPCIHFVVEASISVKNGPEEYIVKDVIKNKFLKATNLDGSLYDAVNGANDATLFRGIGKPGAGKPVVILDDDDERGLVGMDDRGDISGTSMDSKHDHERNVGIRKSLRRYGH